MVFDLFLFQNQPNHSYQNEALKILTV